MMQTTTFAARRCAGVSAALLLGALLLPGCARGLAESTGPAAAHGCRSAASGAACFPVESLAPAHAVTFFVEAAREGDARGALVPRDFFQIPVHSRADGRFVWAVPQGHVPLEVDLAIRAEAARVLADYRARRPRYTNADGSVRAVELRRDWYAETGAVAPAR
jgi:hypothetical protein